MAGFREDFSHRQSCRCGNCDEYTPRTLWVEWALESDLGHTVSTQGKPVQMPPIHAADPIVGVVGVRVYRGGGVCFAV